MKNKILLIATIVAVLAMGLVMSGCSCNKSDSKETTAKNEQTANQETYKNVASDDFPTISNDQKTTDKNGNEVVKYTNAKGQKVTRITKKDGTVKIIIRDKKGKVIKEKEFKDEAAAAAIKKQEQNKKNNKKDSKKEDDKKDEKKDEKAGVMNDNDGNWSDFY